LEIVYDDGGPERGVITPTSSRIQDGDIQLGNYLMHSMSHLSQPDVVTAIIHSCDGYFYRLGLKLGPERFEKWVNIFQFGHRTGIDLPHEYSGIPPTPTKKAAYARALVRGMIRKRCEAQGLTDEAKEKCEQNWTEQDKRMLEHESRFTDYDMASSAFGQGQNASTPIQLARYVGALANGGHMNTPHLLLRAGAGVDRNGNQQPEVTYADKNSFRRADGA
jgi:penicillin-binding protein 2